MWGHEGGLPFVSFKYPDEGICTLEVQLSNNVAALRCSRAVGMRTTGSAGDAKGQMYPGASEIAWASSSPRIASVGWAEFPPWLLPKFTCGSPPSWPSPGLLWELISHPFLPGSYHHALLHESCHRQCLHGPFRHLSFWVIWSHVHIQNHILSQFIACDCIFPESGVMFMCFFFFLFDFISQRSLI